MGLFSKKPQAAATPEPRPTASKSAAPQQTAAQPAVIAPERLAEARAFMADWVNIVGQASDPVFWDALARFGRIGGATQAPNTQGGNMRIFDVAKSRFNNDFAAMFDWPWRNWLAIAKKANEVADHQLAVQVFFFAWTIQNQVTFDMNTSAEVGFQQPSTATFKEIAAAAWAAADAAPADFAVTERATESPVPRSSILLGTSQLLG